ncbi:hypothetical protein EV714DRAFT_273620 [Schizophyllum commune]
MLRKCINVFTSSGPNIKAIGLLNDVIESPASTTRTNDAKQAHQCPLELAQCHWYRAPRPPATTDATQERQCLGSSPNGAATGSSMIPLTTFLRPQDAMQARQCIADSLNGAVIGQRNDVVDPSSLPNGANTGLLNEDFVIAPWKFRRLKPSPSSGNDTKLRAMVLSSASTVKTQMRIARLGLASSNGLTRASTQ